VAGVTFLAFGNGSPDVFSTFSAMKRDSGSLAIGELFGAASFIVSCVVGSMCIIKPFKVDRYPFLRDVGFFSAAVSMLLVVLWDGRIYAWEAWTLVLIYAVYVLVVVVGSWWERKQSRKRKFEALIRDEYRSEEIPQITFTDTEPYRDEPEVTPPETPSLIGLPGGRPRAKSGPPRIQTQLSPHPVIPDSRSPSPSRSLEPRRSARPTHMPSFSLIGALEFRNVIAALQSEAASTSLDIFQHESPLTPYVHAHYPHHHTWSRPRTPAEGEEVDPWDAALGVRLDDRSPHLSPDDTVDQPQGIDTLAAPSETDTESQHYSLPTKRQRVLHVLARTFHILFPTLHHWTKKSFTSKVLSVFAAPAVMALTVTLPVVVTPYISQRDALEKSPGATDERLIDFEEEGVEIERALIAEEEVEEMHELKFNKWLMAVQCALGPLFCAGVLFHGAAHEMWLLLATGIGGVAAGILVAVFATKGENPAPRMLRTCMGFFVAMVWIMAIADEVVGVLQTFGFIFGLSDAIIGLTIFAVGNSLADFVANMSVAVFAPIMGFSACFGGPMLNMLLGIGISGSYIISQSTAPYVLPFSPTLMASGLGLLALLLISVVFVPINGYHLTRRWGVFLVCCYVVVMAVNISVEVWNH